VSDPLFTMGRKTGTKSRHADRWITVVGTVFAALLLAVLIQGAAQAVVVPPLALPGPYAVECSNVAQDFSRLSPGEDAVSYWRGVARANGSQRRPADLLTDPASTPMVTVDAPNNHDLFGSFAGRSFSYVVVICHPTSAANPRPDYALPTGRPLPHMLRAGETPLWPDATTRFPILVFSHGYGESPIESDYVLAMTVFASFGYVVVAPFHTDATFSDLQSLEGFLVLHRETERAHFMLLQRAVLDQIERVVRKAGAQIGVPVGVTGEVDADVFLVPLLRFLDVRYREARVLERIGAFHAHVVQPPASRFAHGHRMKLNRPPGRNTSSSSTARRFRNFSPSPFATSVCSYRPTNWSTFPSRIL